MKAVMLSVSERLLEERRARGADRWDEMWEGVLHMPPPPSSGHQGFVTRLGGFLDSECERRSLGTVLTQAGLYDEEQLDSDYRVPDVVFVAKAKLRLIQDRGVVGAADVVIEVRSKDDETYEKFPFFARLGVRQVIVIDAKTRKTEIYLLAGREYVAVAPDRDGWLAVEALGVRIRWVSKRRLRVEAVDNPKIAIDL